jgi:hypothetical protein
MRFDSRRSLEELRIEPRPAEGSLAEAMAWFRECGWLKTI